MMLWQRQATSMKLRRIRKSHKISTKSPAGLRGFSHMGGIVLKEIIQLLAECEGASRIGISGHIRPDGDCVGSCLALWQYLKKAMPDAYIKVFLQKPADIFGELKGFELIDSNFGEEAQFDVFFALDCNKERLGGAEKYFEQAKKTINIDHHISNADGCGVVNYVRPEVGSTSELIYDLILAEGNDKMLDKELAKTIYTGIIHDTGVFQYSNTTPKTMEVGAKLICYGFDFTRLIEETFYQKTYAQTRILGYALKESMRLMEGKCVVSFITKKDMEDFQVSIHDLDGIVNQLRNIKGVHCAIFMYETEEEEYKVSLRSDEYVDVAKVASFFGGGGHMRAAGCSMKGTFHNCINNLSLHIERQLRNGTLEKK